MYVRLVTCFLPWSQTQDRPNYALPKMAGRNAPETMKTHFPRKPKLKNGQKGRGDIILKWRGTGADREKNTKKPSYTGRQSSIFSRKSDDKNTECLLARRSTEQEKKREKKKKKNSHWRNVKKKKNSCRRQGVRGKQITTRTDWYTWPTRKQKMRAPNTGWNARGGAAGYARYGYTTRGRARCTRYSHAIRGRARCSR